MLAHNLEPHRQGATETKPGEFGYMSLFVRQHDIDVYLVDKLEAVVAVSIVLIINSLEKRIALPIQILLRDEGVPAKDRLRDFLVCIAVEFHSDWSISVG